MTAFVLLLVTEVMPIEPSTFFKNWLIVSLVTLFFKSFVITSPIGKRFACDTAAGGFASTLSLSYSGNRLTIF